MPEELRLKFTKEGRARYISHLDLIRTFQRAFLRGGMHIKHSEGYVPHPFVSIALPLSVGYFSTCELMDFVLESGAQPEEAADKLNAVLPEGIVVLKCYPTVRPFKELAYLRYQVEMSYEGGVPEKAAERLGALLGQESLVVRKKSKKAKCGYTEIDVIPLISSYKIEEAGDTLILEAILRAQNPGLNPQVLVNAMGERLPELIPDYLRYTRQEALDEELRVFE